MDTINWEILAGVLLFAAGNVAYFEIRRLIQFLQNHSNESKPGENGPGPGYLDRGREM